MTPATADRLTPAFRRLERFIEEGAIDGAALAIAEGQELIAEWYGGQASPDRAAQADTLWPLACISKLYTATTVMTLVERGELTLSLPVHALLPDFTESGRESVRLRHLLTHTSGLIRSTPARSERLLRRQAPLWEHLEEAYTHPLLFQPGTAFNYTDHGYAVAGQVAEAAGGRPLAELVWTLVLKPRGLDDTFLPPPLGEYSRVAYVKGVLAEGTDGAMYNSAYARQLAHPGLGAVATVRDLLRFGLFFAPGSPDRVLSAASIRGMTTDQTGGDAVGHVLPLYPAQRQPWGLGFSIRGALGNGFEDIASPPTFDHVGATGSILLVDPVANITIAFVSNRFIDSDREHFVLRLSTVVGTVLAALT